MLYRCNLPESGGYLAWLVWLLCGIGPVLLALAMWHRLPLRRPRERSEFVSDVLWMSLLFGEAAYLVSGNEKDRGTLRYLVPFVLAGAVLTGRVLGTRRGSVRHGRVTHGAGGDLRRDRGLGPGEASANDPAAELARWLDEHQLRSGYGPYWDASIVTASGRGRVAVRPVRGREVGPRRLVIEPFRWMSDEAWYREGPANFVVYKPDPGPKWHFLVNETVCTACFGRPSAQHSVGPYVVLVWNRDLRPLLTAGLPWTP